MKSQTNRKGHYFYDKTISPLLLQTVHIRVYIFFVCACVCVRVCVRVCVCVCVSCTYPVARLDVRPLYCCQVPLLQSHSLQPTLAPDKVGFLVKILCFYIHIDIVFCYTETAWKQIFINCHRKLHSVKNN